MEKKVFPAPAVAGYMSQLVEARIHNDGANQAEVRAWQDGMIKTLATPSYALIDPQDERILAIHEGPETDPELFAEWLGASLRKYAAN